MWKIIIYKNHLGVLMPAIPLLINDEKGWTIFKNRVKENYVKDLWIFMYTAELVSGAVTSVCRDPYPHIDTRTGNINMPDSRCLWRVSRVRASLQRMEMKGRVKRMDYSAELHSTHYPIKLDQRNLRRVRAITVDDMRDALEEVYYENIREINEDIQRTIMQMLWTKK